MSAIEAIDENGLLSIQTTCQENSDTITMIVQDNGCGIPEDIRQNIFDPFFNQRRRQGRRAWTGRSLRHYRTAARENPGAIATAAGHNIFH
jgi:two-component system NtrC family sensor kinase